MTPNGERTALYRLYNAEGKLLYVGITNNPEKRFAQHAAGKSWWEDVARRDVEWFSSRLGASAAEEIAIRRHAPYFNNEHSPDWPHIRVAVEVSENMLRALDVLATFVRVPPTFTPEQRRDIVLTLLLNREFSARGLTGDPRCLHNAGLPWPDGVAVQEGTGELCSCGYILEANGDYGDADGEKVA